VPWPSWPPWPACLPSLATFTQTEPGRVPGFFCAWYRTDRPWLCKFCIVNRPPWWPPELGPWPRPLDAQTVARVPHAGDLVALVRAAWCVVRAAWSACLGSLAVFVFVLLPGPCL
jgi:hypothetical protein